MNFTVGDFIIRIKNAVGARRKTIVLLFSNMSKAIGDVLVKEGYLQSIKVEEKNGKKSLIAQVGYSGRAAVFTDVNIISKPSLRVYATTEELAKKQRKSLGRIIVSTSNGVMTGKEALKKGLGGELLFEIW